MKNYATRMTELILHLAVVAVLACGVGCDTGGKTGGLIGSGVGALVGQAIGGDTEATLIGTAVGGGIGYIIGNEEDKKHAREMSYSSREYGYTHTEVDPLGGTTWRVVSVNPPPEVGYASKTVEFRPYGQVITTTTDAEGHVRVDDERYRVVGETLIVNRPKMMINARYAIEGDQLVLSAVDFSAVLERVR